jgi:cell division protein FtsI/penicillin-binding protein 2
MAVATSAVANGGTVWQPSLAWSSTDSNGKETLLPRNILSKGFISARNMQISREGMRQTVLSGSARPLNTLKVTSAGKTGTAEFGNKGLTHAWYTGFAPYENPEIVFSILIEGGGDSFYSSVPVAEEILRGYFNDPLPEGAKLNAAPNLDNLAPGEWSGEH